MFIIAYNEHGRTVNAHDLCATPELRAWARKSRFECVECAERHPVHICFRDLEKAELSGRTSHGPAWWHHRGGGGIGSGGGAAESERHWHAKHILSEHVGRYSFVTSMCQSCERHTAVEAGAEATGAVEYEHKLAGGRSYRFDAVLLQGARVRSVLEVWESHETSAEKRAQCLQLGYTFGEFDARHVVQQHEQAQGAAYTLQNLKIAYFECAECAEDKVLRRERRRLQEEETERLQLEKREEWDRQRAERVGSTRLDLQSLRAERAESERLLLERRRVERVESESLQEERLRVESVESERLDARRQALRTCEAVEAARSRRLAAERQEALTLARLKCERAERERAVLAEQKRLEHSRLSASVLGIKAECVRYAEGRRALDAVIARKTQNSECWEEERLAHNKLLALELDAESRSMKALVRMRRMGLTETKYQ